MQEWEFKDPGRAERIVYSEEAEAALMAEQGFQVSENDWRQTQTLLHENINDTRTLQVLFEQHCLRSEHMDDIVSEKVDTLSTNVTRILTKLDNGFSKDVELLKKSRLDKDDVRQVVLEMQQGNKKRGREWLAAISAVCMLGVSVVAILLGLN
jgi:hypothetical protein